MDKTKLPDAPDLSQLAGRTGPASMEGSGAADATSASAAGPGRVSEKTGLPSTFVDTDKSDRGGVFHQLVADDGDIAGLVAYSIYKQNKLDWLNSFEAVRHRAPNEDEIASYIIGEGTPRRLATYRHLAEATLAGNGPTVGASVASGHPRVARSAGGFGAGNLAVGVVATYALIAVLLLIVFLLLAHYTMNPR